MTIWGVVFMALSWGLILFLTVYSFSKVLGKGGKKGNEIE